MFVGLLTAQNSPLPFSGFRIAGKVVNAVGATPIASARVTILDANNPQNTASAITSEDGNFGFNQIPAGKYALSGDKRGFISSSYQQHEQFSTAIVTGAGFDTEHLVLRLAPFAVLSGKVLDESGEPVRQATVALYRQDHRLGIERTHRMRSETTDDLGTYEFSRLDAGTYFVSVTATPWYAVHRSTNQENESAQNVSNSFDVAYPVTYYKDVAESDEALPIAIRGGDHLEADIHLNPVPALHLIFRPPRNQENAFAPPTLERPEFDGMDFVRTEAQTTGKGTWELSGIPAGTYSVRFPGSDLRGGVDLSMEITQDGQVLDPSKGEPEGSVKASIQALSEQTLPHELSVALRNSKLSVVRWEQVDAKGEVKFDDLAPGKYEALIQGPEKAYSLVRMTSSEGEIPGHVLTITPGSSVNLTLSVVGSTANVEGFVKRKGKPVAGAMVVLIPKDTESNRTLFRRDQSDMDGSFNLLNVIPGTYTIVAIEDGWDLDWASPGVIASYAPRGKPVSVAANQGTLHLPDAVEAQPK